MRYALALLLLLGCMIGVTATAPPASAGVTAASYTLSAAGNTKTRDVKVNAHNKTSKKQKLRITVTLAGLKVRAYTGTAQGKSTISHTFKLNSYTIYVVTLDRWTGSGWERVATADATVAPPRVNKSRMQIFITCIKGSKIQAVALFNSGNKDVKAKFWVAKSATPEPVHAEDFFVLSSHLESLTPGQKAYVRYKGKLHTFERHTCN